MVVGQRDQLTRNDVIANAILRVGISLAVTADGQERLNEQDTPLAGFSVCDLLCRGFDDVIVIPVQELGARCSGPVAWTDPSGAAVPRPIGALQNGHRDYGYNKQFFA